MDRTLRVLLIEDSPDDAELLIQALEQNGYEPLWERVETAESMNAALARQELDVILADYSLPRFSAPEALALMRSLDRDIPFIVVTGSMGEEVAVKMMRAGAQTLSTRLWKCSSLPTRLTRSTAEPPVLG